VCEADGLAMSSRNVNLSHEDREKVCLLLEVAFCFFNEPFFTMLYNRHQIIERQILSIL
jgi:pantothenate synthetase